MTLYISGPMTGIKDKNYLAFRQAADFLECFGYQVVNPHDLDKYDTKVTWEGCLRRDIMVLLLDCEGVATLPNWRKSRGARLEIYIAKALSIPVKPVGTWVEENPCQPLKELKENV